MTNNIFLDKEWQERHFCKIKGKAGKRYTPEIHVDLPITKVFDSITRNKKFYASIRKRCGELNRELSSILPPKESENIQRKYDSFKAETTQLLSLLKKIKEYDTNQIPWDKINERTEQSLRSFNQLKEAERSENLSSSNVLNDKIQEKLRYFEELSLSIEADLSNSPFLLLTGKAGEGKTHLLCDLLKSRFRESSPAILTFGQDFLSTDFPCLQIRRQLGLEPNKRQFLKLLNEAGEQSNCRAIIAIDALNETARTEFWKENLEKLVGEIKKYPNIALVISVRTGFEQEIMAENTKRMFFEREHDGFKYKELEAMDKFFSEFGIPKPEVPPLMPEFQKPLFLLLFCKAFEKRAKNNGQKKQIFRGHEGATYIFESFVKNVSGEIIKKFELPNRREEIWNTVIKEMASEMVRENTNKVPENLVINLIKASYPSKDHFQLVKELERSSLIEKIPRYSVEKKNFDGFDFRFPFQKFSDHLIGRYLFKKYEEEFGKSNKNLKTAKQFFYDRKQFLSDSGNRGIVEMLSIECPERLRGHEFIEVAPYLKDSPDAQEAFIESLIWRKPTAFSESLENTLNYINKIIAMRSGYPNSLLNAFLTVSPIPNHPFNADCLHKNLARFSMAERDVWWSIFLHSQNCGGVAVDRLIEWGWSGQDKEHITDDAICLYAVPLCWFLTTSNRFVRDKATKSLVTLLTGRLGVVLRLLKQFKDVNDPYVSERLYAVAYGCSIRSKKDRRKLKKLTIWVYNQIFKSGYPPAHILLRDYARGIIEVALHEKIKLEIEPNKIKPPFNSDWPKNVPPKEQLKEKYYLENEGNGRKLSRIWSSIMLEHGRMGDFGEYILDSEICNWSKKRLSNETELDKFNDTRSATDYLSGRFDAELAKRWILNRIIQLGWKQEVHEKIDDCMQQTGLTQQKEERISKKYQWIALHELLARISDNFEFNERNPLGKSPKYEGIWQLSIRDIDPTCILRKIPSRNPDGMPNFGGNKLQGLYSGWYTAIDKWFEWLKASQDLPDTRKIVEFTDNNECIWLALDFQTRWLRPTLPEDKESEYLEPQLWYRIKSYLVKAEDKNKVFEWAKQQNFMNNRMPESREFSEICLGEYPWAPAFRYCDNPHYQRDGWTNCEGKIPAKVLVTDDLYLSSGSHEDCSSAAPYRVKLPAKFIVDEMALSQPYIDGRFFDSRNNLVAFDPGIFHDGMSGCVLIKKKELCNFLKRKKYALIWTLLGEKIMPSDTSNRLEINGAYTLNDKNRLIGSKKCKKICEPAN